MGGDSAAAFDLLTKLTVAGLLFYFISLVMKSAWITRKHYDDVIAQLEQRLKDKDEETDFWKTYSQRRDDDLRELTVTTAKALDAAQKALDP